MMHTSEHGDTAKHSEHTAQEAVSEEVMLPLTMPIFPPGMFCFSQLHTRVSETHMLWSSAQDMTVILPQTTVLFAT